MTVAETMKRHFGEVSQLLRLLGFQYFKRLDSQSKSEFYCDSNYDSLCAWIEVVNFNLDKQHIYGEVALGEKKVTVDRSWTLDKLALVAMKEYGEDKSVRSLLRLRIR